MSSETLLPSPVIADWPDICSLIFEKVTQRISVQPQLHQLQAFQLVQLPVRLQLNTTNWLDKKKNDTKIHISFIWIRHQQMAYSVQGTGLVT